MGQFLLNEPSKDIKISFKVAVLGIWIKFCEKCNKCQKISSLIFNLFDRI
jgi:hypothetical protein